MTKGIIVVDVPELYEGETISPILQYGDYMITSLGRVWSKKTNIFLKQRKDKNGYMLVNLYSNGLSVTHKVHRLVAEAFIEKPYDKHNLEINHKDENKSNNNVCNLEWCNHKYNANYGTKNRRSAEKLKKLYKVNPNKAYWKGKKITEKMRQALIKNGKSYVGSKNPNAKPVRCIENNEEFGSASEAGEKMNINASSIRNCCSGKSLTAGGYHWERLY